MTTVAIVDYGMSNLGSVYYALDHLASDKVQVCLSADPQVIADADKVVLPGQGAAWKCMAALQQTGMDKAVVEAIREKPFFGICMGLQLLLEHSTENEGVDCLGLFAGTVQHLGHKQAVTANQKIPHMGWNQVKQTHPHPLWHGIDKDAYFYFAHSYHAVPDDENLVVATTEYNVEFVAAVAKDSIFSVQFHPEKSAANGMRLLKNFLTWEGTC